MLGVTTEVTVKLLPKPPVARVLLASFDSVEKAGLAVGDIIANGIIPGGLEMMITCRSARRKILFMPVIRSTPKRFCYASWTAWSLTYRKIASGLTTSC